MGYIGRKKLLLALLLTVGLVISAQASSSSKSAQKSNNKKELKVSTEFGLGVGARYNFLTTQPVSADFSPNINMRMSYGAALQFRLNVGKFFGIQPEISYAYSNLRIVDDVHNFSTKINYSIVQIPVLLSIRVAMFRFNAGPVFTLMDSPYYFLKDSNGASQQQYMGALYPTVTYTAGVSMKIAKRTIVDIRYADQFCDRKVTNAYVWSLDQNEQADAQEFRVRSQSIQLRVGIVF